MKITCLNENTPYTSDFACEHGLSLYIETDGKNILFDMGQTDLFIKNAEKLGVDLSKVDLAVVSHGHYDHGGGLSAFLQINKTAPIYLSEYAFEEHYNGEKYIGLDKSLCDDTRLRFVKDNCIISDNITLCHENAMPLVCDIDSGGLTAVLDGIKTDEVFRHEMYMLVKEQGRNILISGCSHKGIVNIESHFQPDILVGGFHLSKYPLDSNLKSIAQRLSQNGAKLVTCHCTGIEQYEFMKMYIPDLDYISSGRVMIL